MTFQSPNYTQVPNDFFDMLPNMKEAELRVTIAMIRQTFGFHRRGFKMSITELAQKTGLSEQGTRNGVEDAEARGTFTRVNPDSKKTAEWNLNVVDLPNLVEVQPQLSGGQTPTTLTSVQVLNKDIKKEKEKRVPKKKGDYLDLLAEMSGNENSQQALRIAEMYDTMDREFKSFFARNKNNDVVVKFVLQRLEYGETIERFVQWANRDEFNASRIWEYAENPIKIKTRWQVAMSETSGQVYTGAIEGIE